MGLITRLLVIHGLSNSIHVVYSRMQKGMVKAYDIVHTVKSEEPEYHQVTDPDKQTDGEFNIVHTVKSEEPEYQQVTDPDKQTDGEFNQAKWGADVL